MRSTLPVIFAAGLLCSCKFVGGPGGGSDIDAAAIDGDPGDGGVGGGDATPCQNQWAPAHLDPCDPPPINNPLVITAGSTYDTGTNELRVDGGGVVNPNTITLTTVDPPVRVLFVQSLEIQDGGVLDVSGTMPLLLASNDVANIAGDLSVAAAGTTPAAGSDPTDCATNPAEVGQDDNGGGGGGGGGAFQGSGGTGGTGDDDDAGMNFGDGGAGGAARTAPTSPAGGCSGAPGGSGSAMDFGAGGAGGGALQLSARNAISVTGDGAIDAAGGGGRGADGDDCGAGGGGSGGYIRLDSPDIDVLGDSTVTANGGGGGGGSTGNPNANGSPGSNGQRSATRAPGGNSSGASASGGASGGAGTNLDANSQNNTAPGGGGGGGGAVGFVIIPTAALELGTLAIISPDPTEPP